MDNQCKVVSLTGLERLLNWLGPDSHSAGRKYESIRARLIAMFLARRCVFAEDLADITFERVGHILTNRTPEFIGDPALYIYGVAKKILLEHLRELKAYRLRVTCRPPISIDNSDCEDMLAQLDIALSMIPKADRELVLKYYRWPENTKSDHRRAMADQLGIEPNALRLRVFRIRQEIKKNMVQLDTEPGRK